MQQQQQLPSITSIQGSPKRCQAAPPSNMFGSIYFDSEPSPCTTHLKRLKRKRTKKGQAIEHAKNELSIINWHQQSSPKHRFYRFRVCMHLPNLGSATVSVRCWCYCRRIISTCCYESHTLPEPGEDVNYSSHINPSIRQHILPSVLTERASSTRVHGAADKARPHEG